MPSAKSELYHSTHSEQEETEETGAKIGNMETLHEVETNDPKRAKIYKRVEVDSEKLQIAKEKLCI